MHSRHKKHIAYVTAPGAHIIVLKKVQKLCLFFLLSRDKFENKLIIVMVKNISNNIGVRILAPILWY